MPYKFNPWTSERQYSVGQLYSQSKQILVTGFSNIAIDNIALGLQRHKIGPILRVGRSQSILTEDTVDDRMKKHSMFPELEQARGTGQGFKIEKKIQSELVSSAKVVLATCI